MSKIWVVAAALLLLGGVGCARDRTEGSTPSAESSGVPATSKDTFALGTSLTPDGAVPRDATGQTFGRGGEVFLSINVEGASGEQAIGVKWVGPEGDLLREDEIEVPKGSQYASFSSGNTREWRPGQHRAVITINGRRVSERAFEVM